MTMSEAFLKIEQLLRRAEALEEKVDKTLNIKEKKPDGRDKLSLKKNKRRHKYSENKENIPNRNITAKPQKSRLFSSIQFSSSSDEEDQVLGKTQAGRVGVVNQDARNKLFTSSLSTAYSSSLLTSSREFSDTFVPDSCGNQKSESLNSSRNISDLIRDVVPSTVRNSNGSECSDVGRSVDAASFYSSQSVLLETCLNENSSSKQEDAWSTNKYSLANPDGQLEGHSSDSVLVLSQRLERLLPSKPNNARKGKLISKKSTNAAKKETRSGKTSGDRMKLVNAICFSSDDEVANDVDEKVSENVESSLSASHVTRVSETHGETAPEEIISLTNRLERILLVSSTKKTQNRKCKRSKVKKIQLPILFSSDSDDDDMQHDKEQFSATSHKQDGNIQVHSENDTDELSLMSPQKKDISLQVSVSSDKESCPEAVTESSEIEQTATVGSVCDKSLQCSYSQDTINKMHEISTFNTNEADESFQGSMDDRAGTKPNLNSKHLSNEKTNSMSSECPDAGESDSSLEGKPPLCNISLQVSMMTPNVSMDDDVGLISRFFTDEKTNSLQSESPDACESDSSLEGKPPVCNISLQVSMTASESLDESPREDEGQDAGSYGNSRSNGRDILVLDDNDSDLADAALYTTAIGCNISNHLYSTNTENKADSSSLDQLFIEEDHDHHGNSASEKNVKDDDNSEAMYSLLDGKTSSAQQKVPDHRVAYSSDSESSVDLPCRKRESFTRNLTRNCSSSAVQINNTASPHYEHDDEVIVSGSHPGLSSSSSEDQLESFLQEMQKPMNKKTTTDLADFIVADDELSTEEEDSILFYLQTNKILSCETQKELELSNISKQPKSATSQRIRSVSSDESLSLSDNDTDEENDACKTPFARSTKPYSLTCRPKKSKRPILSQLSNFATPLKMTISASPAADDTRRKGFLSSLGANLDDCQRDLESIKYVRNFKKHKEELTSRLFKLYNQTVFSNKLPADLSICWNSRMYKTAGYCTYKKNRYDIRTTKVELSVKVCDTAERVRDTLIHELCHAAVWLLHGKLDGHGPLWKHWAYKANLIHPELPVISRCHNYKIHTKYTYKCTKCGYQIGRHSKSLDTASKVCGYCMAPFELISNTKNGQQTPRKPNRFALFVKNNYGSVKKQGHLSHQKVMKILSAEFSSKTNLDA